jgi:hypothetical protein
MSLLLEKEIYSCVTSNVCLSYAYDMPLLAKEMRFLAKRAYDRLEDMVMWCHWFHWTQLCTDCFRAHFPVMTVVPASGGTRMKIGDHQTRQETYYYYLNVSDVSGLPIGCFTLEDGTDFWTTSCGVITQKMEEFSWTTAEACDLVFHVSSSMSVWLSSCLSSAPASRIFVIFDIGEFY